MEEALALTHLLNHLFAGPVDALLQWSAFIPQIRPAPINDTFALELLVVLGSDRVLPLWFALTLSVEKPTRRSISPR